MGHSFSSADPQPPLAFQLAAALDRYEAATEVLIETWLDADLYMEVSRELDAIKVLAAAFPHFAPAFIELSTSHSELVYALWSRSQSEAAAPLEPVCRRHRESLAALQAKARALLCGS